MPRRRHHKKSSSSHIADSRAEIEKPPHLPYIIKHSDTLGRYLMASRELAEGIELINEDPLVVGPAQDSLPSCLGCYTPLSNIVPIRCERCLWPLCSKSCKGLFRRFGHSKEECNILSKCDQKSNSIPLDQLYNAIVPLRCLLLRQHRPEDWQTLMTMEAHNEIRRKINSIWEYNQKTVVNRIVGEWKITDYSEEEIHNVCGILEVNAFAVGDESLNIRGLYPTLFLVAHSCVPNTSHTDNDQYHMKLFSSVPIKINEIITLTYANTLQGTRERRAHLKQCKFFDCECARCKDPTELGTYLSALKCSECHSGHLLPSDPLCSAADWVCSTTQCPRTLLSFEVDEVLSRIREEITVLDHGNIKELENSIKHYSDLLHPNHYLIVEMKYSLSQLYGKAVGYLIHEMSEYNLERKKDVCEDVLSVFDMLEPGLSSVRGLTMYELHAPIMVLTIQRFHMRKLSKVELCKKLRKVAFYLQECIHILKFEETSSREGCIRIAAEGALCQLKSWEPVVGKL